MDESKLLALLERGVIALEAIARRSGNGEAVVSPHEPVAEQNRKTLLSRFEGLYITIDQARDALKMGGASSKAVGAAVSAAGFDRRRWSDGVKFAICEPGGTCVGAPVVLPDNLDESVQMAKAAKENHGRKITAEQVLYGAYLMAGKTAKPSQVTPQHLSEVRRLYPGLFED